MTSERNQSDDDGQPDSYLAVEKHGSNMRVYAVVDGEQVFFAEPDAKRSDPVIRAAVRTFGRRAWPELANDEADDGGAFQ